MHEHGVALGRQHSEFGRIVLTRELTWIPPCFDPRKAIPRDHIERAGKYADTRPADIEAQVAPLSAHLDWDRTRSANAI